MNLITDPWIPVIRRDGSEQWIRPAQITDDFDNNPIERISAARPDFTGSLYQFLIGLIQTAMTPRNNDEWIKWVESPPSVDNLDQKFSKEKDAFNLDGKRPRFMQDFDLVEDSDNNISSLFIDAPGGNTIRLNRDHFVKRGSIERVCPSCAATALYTLQTNAPSGGVGHRVSLRGGGPLTVLYTPKGSKDDPIALWLSIWYNIVTEKTLNGQIGASGKKSKTNIFPWMAPTITSEAKTGRAVTGADMHPLQVFWGMPRRIVLSEPVSEQDECHICGRFQDSFYIHYTTKNYGVEYAGGIRHPLSPYYVSDNQGTLLPQHPQPGGFSYRYWPFFALGGNNNGEPPSTLAEMNQRLANQTEKNILAFGYNMDNMKARCWYETIMPVFLLEPEQEDFVQSRVDGMIKASEQIVKNSRGAIKSAWYKRPDDKKGDVTFLDQTFWSGTEPEFFNVVQKLIKIKKWKENISEINPIMETWHRYLNLFSLDLFEQYVERYPIEWAEPKRIVKAREDLLKSNQDKKIKEALGLPIINNKRAG